MSITNDYGGWNNTERASTQPSSKGAPRSVQGMWGIIQGLQDVEKRITEDLTLPSENKAQIAAKARQAELNRVRVAASQLLTEAADRMAAASRHAATVAAKHADARDWQKATALGQEAQAWAGSVRSWGEVRDRIERAGDNREALEALLNVALPVLERRADDPNSPLHGIAGAHPVATRQAIEDRLWQMVPDSVKQAAADALQAERDYDELRREVGDMSMVAGGITAYAQRADPFRDLVDGTPKTIFSEGSGDEAQPEPARGIFGQPL